MATKRISKSSIEWAKFAQIVHPSEAKHFQAFKARSDAYLTRVLSNPETPPAIKFEEYRNKVSAKETVQQLENAYKSLKIPYPKDTMSHEVDKQEADHSKNSQEYVGIANLKIEHAKKMQDKFKVMIPVRHMTMEDFSLTFPDWSNTIDNPSIFPHYDKTPGLTREQAAKLAAPEGKPFSTI